MCDPVEQDFHSTDRFDDESIASCDRLLRHLCIPVQVIPTGEGYRLSDQAFKPRRADPGASVDIECLLLKDGQSHEDRHGRQPNSYALVEITAGEARPHSGGVAWTPKPEEPELEGFAREPNPYHGEIIKPISNAAFREMAALARVLWLKPGVNIAKGPFRGGFLTLT